FRLGRQTVARPLQVIRGHLHARSVLVCLVRQVAPLLLRDPLLLTQPVTIGCCIVPSHLDYRAILVRGIFLFKRMIFAEEQKLYRRHFLGSYGKTSVNRVPATLPVSHPEFARFGHDPHGLSLPVYVPLPLFSGCQSPVKLLEFVCCLPLPQEPFGGTVN